MGDSLTSEQREEYKLIRKNFKEKRKGIDKDIGENKVVLENAMKNISKLEKDIVDARPFLDGCDTYMICKLCDIYSMKYLGSTPNPDKYYVYECVICGHEDRHT
jgi:hypothetical protein